MLRREQIGQVIEGVLCLGLYYSSYLAMLIIYPRAKDDPKYQDNLGDLLISIQSTCQRLQIPPVGRYPKDDQEAKDKVMNFFSDVGAIAAQVEKKYGHELGSSFILSSSATARSLFGKMVPAELANTLAQTLEMLAHEIGIDSNVVTRFVESHDPRPLGKEIVASLAAKIRPFLFISYSHIDRTFAIAFSKRLANAGIEHFLDEKSIGYGEEIAETIHETLEKSTHLVVLLSPASEKSSWVGYEIGRASKIGLTPVVYSLYPSVQLPSYLPNSRTIRSRKDEKQFVSQLVTQ